MTGVRRIGTVLVVGMALVLGVAACGDDGADPDRFCEVDGRFEQLGDFLALPSDEAPEAVAEARDILSDGLKAAPDEIRPSYALLVDAFIPILDVFEAADFGASPTDQEALGAAFAAFDSDEVRAASDAVENWVDANCSG